VDARTSSADEFADKAGKTQQITWISKSNSLRRTAKQKTAELKLVSWSLTSLFRDEAELKAVDELLDEKLLQLKNC